MAKNCIAKLKFWFGKENGQIFNHGEYEVERSDCGQFVYVYER
jgi:hypothetical protein